MKTASNATLEKIERYAPRIFKEAEALEKKEILAARQEKADALAKLKAKTEQDVSKLLAEQAKAWEAVKEAEAGMMAKRQAWGEVSARLSSTKHAANVQTKALENYLTETAGLELEEAIKFFQGRFDYLRGPGRLEVKKVETKKFLTGRKTSLWSSNKSEVERAMQYCQDAVETLEDMMLDAALNVEFIEQLKNDLPEIAKAQ